MDAAFPWWLTVLGWLVAAGGTLGGVIWTQYRADVRDRDRAKEERLTRQLDRRLELYRELLVKAQGLRRMVATPEPDEYAWEELKQALFLFGDALAETHVLGSHDVVEAADTVRIAAQEANRASNEHSAGSVQAAQTMEVLASTVADLRSAIRRDLGVSN